MRFYNTGKYLLQIGRSKDTGDMVERVVDMRPVGQEIGSVIINFPGHKFVKVVKAGEWVDLPEDLSEHVVKSACPSLVTEADLKSPGEDTAKILPAPSATKKAKE